MLERKSLLFRPMTGAQLEVQLKVVTTLMIASYRVDTQSVVRTLCRSNTLFVSDVLKPKASLNIWDAAQGTRMRFQSPH